MATITPTYPEGRAGKSATVLWETVTCGDTGASIELKDFANGTVTATGTFNSQTLTMQGSNDDTNWFTLTDILGANVTFLVNGGKAIRENPRYIRPSLSGSSGGDVDVILQLRKS